MAGGSYGAQSRVMSPHNDGERPFVCDRTLEGCGQAVDRHALAAPGNGPGPLTYAVPGIRPMQLLSIGDWIVMPILC